MNLGALLVHPVAEALLHLFQIFSCIIDISDVWERNLAFISCENRGDFRPEVYGLKGARNFYVTTDGQVTMGVWQILPDQYVLHDSPMMEEYFMSVLKDQVKHVIIYNHGITSLRPIGRRGELFKTLRKHFMVFSFDYRSCHDSKLTNPAEVDLVNDFEFLFSWIRERTSANIFVWGYSLGTSISTTALALKKITATGLVLENPFDSMQSLLSTYRFNRDYITFMKIVTRRMATINLGFFTDKYIDKVDCPILILHAEDDHIIPYDLGRKLYGIATKNRLKSQGPVEFVGFSENLNYGHLDIYKYPGLDNLVADFLNESISWKGDLKIQPPQPETFVVS